MEIKLKLIEYTEAELEEINGNDTEHELLDFYCSGCGCGSFNINILVPWIVCEYCGKTYKILKNNRSETMKENENPACGVAVRPEPDTEAPTDRRK